MWNWTVCHFNFQAYVFLPRRVYTWDQRLIKMTLSVSVSTNKNSDTGQIDNWNPSEKLIWGFKNTYTVRMPEAERCARPPELPSVASRKGGLRAAVGVTSLVTSLAVWSLSFPWSLGYTADDDRELSCWCCRICARTAWWPCTCLQPVHGPLVHRCIHVLTHITHSGQIILVRSLVL